MVIGGLMRWRETSPGERGRGGMRRERRAMAVVTRSLGMCDKLQEKLWRLIAKSGRKVLDCKWWRPVR